MKTAKELRDLSKSQIPKIVGNVLSDVKEHIINSCEMEASRGASHYSIRLKQCYVFVKEELLNECIKLANEFEINGYKVSIYDVGNDYFAKFIMTFSWNGEVQDGLVKMHGKKYHLYDTDNGIIESDIKGGY